MLLRQFIQSVLGLTILATSSFALSNTEFTYNVIDGGIEVTGCVDGCPSDLVIPQTIDGFSVTGIGIEAFNVNQLTSVTIPDRVTVIAPWAFSDNQLTSVTIPDRVTDIGYNAFKNNQLTNVTIGNRVSSIGSMAFAQNQLTNVTFLGDRPEIYPKAFTENNNLSSVSYHCLEASGWPGEPIEGITPELDESCSDTNDHEDDHGHNEYEDNHCEENPDECSSLDGELVVFIDDGHCHTNPEIIEECILFDNGEWYEIVEVHGDNEHEEEYHGDEEYCYPYGDEHEEHEDDHGDEHDHDGHCYSAIDLDQNGSFEALTDALILLRYAFGLRGDNLINGAIATDANVTTAEEIEFQIQMLLP